MLKRFMACVFSVVFFLTSLGQVPFARADEALNLPLPGAMMSLSDPYEPVLVKGLTVHKDNPFMFDFVVDVGNTQLTAKDQNFKTEADRLIKYFFACLTIPEKDLWVNLSPYEKNKMAPDALGQTALGRDLLAEDYILKQLTASLIYPEKDLGREFWNRIYAKSQALYGTKEIPVNTFNKVWILADKATVYEHGQSAFVVDGHLKVLLEEDYLALEKQSVNSKKIASLPTVARKDTGDTHSVASQIVREIVLPELEKEVNQGKNFAKLRQIFNSLILANWYKKNLKEALLTQVYADKSTVKGVNLSDPSVKEKIYEQYLQAYKKGVFNYIKEDAQANGQVIPKKYFSGGFAVNPHMISIVSDRTPGASRAMTSLMLGFVLPIIVSAVTLFNLMSLPAILEASNPPAAAQKADEAMLTAHDPNLVRRIIDEKVMTTSWGFQAKELLRERYGASRVEVEQYSKAGHPQKGDMVILGQRNFVVTDYVPDPFDPFTDAETCIYTFADGSRIFSIDEPMSIAQARNHLQGKRFLVVDDEDALAIMARRMIKTLTGVDTVRAKDGQEAIEILAKDKFDGVLTDVNMPRKDGKVLVAHIKAQYPQMHIVAHTGRFYEHIDFFEKNNVTLLGKPSSQAQLYKALASGFETEKFSAITHPGTSQPTIAETLADAPGQALLSGWAHVGKKSNGVQFEIIKEPTEISTRIAREIADTIELNNIKHEKSVIILFTGKNGENTSRDLVREIIEREIPLYSTTFFYVDEYWMGAGAGDLTKDPRTYRYFAQKNLIGPLNTNLQNKRVHEKQVIIPNGSGDSIENNIASINSALQKALLEKRNSGGQAKADFVGGGVGSRGHLAFIEEAVKIDQEFMQALAQPANALQLRDNNKFLIPAEVLERKAFIEEVIKGRLQMRESPQYRSDLKTALEQKSGRSVDDAKLDILLGVLKKQIATFILEAPAAGEVGALQAQFPDVRIVSKEESEKEVYGVEELAFSTIVDNYSDFVDQIDSMTGKAISAQQGLYHSSRRVRIATVGPKAQGVLGKLSTLTKPDVHVPISTLLNHPDAKIIIDLVAGAKVGTSDLKAQKVLDESNLKAKTILIFHRNMDVAKTLQILLQRHGAKVEIMSSGTELETRVARGGVDLVLSNPTNPVVNVPELILKLRTANPQLPVVIWTGGFTDVAPFENMGLPIVKGANVLYGIRIIAQQLADKAIISFLPKGVTPGGIDLTNADSGLTVKKDAHGGVTVNFDPAMISRIQKEGVRSVVPFIINIRPIVDMRPLLGMGEVNQENEVGQLAYNS